MTIHTTPTTNQKISDLTPNLAGNPLVFTKHKKPDAVLIKFKDLKQIRGLVKKIEDRMEKERIQKLHDAFVERVLAAEKESDENDIVIETDEDHRRFFDDLKKRIQTKKHDKNP